MDMLKESWVPCCRGAYAKTGPLRAVAKNVCDKCLLYHNVSQLGDEELWVVTDNVATIKLTVHITLKRLAAFRRRKFAPSKKTPPHERLCRGGTEMCRRATVKAFLCFFFFLRIQLQSRAEIINIKRLRNDSWMKIDLHVFVLPAVLSI